MAFRQYLVGVIVVALLIWGPSDTLIRNGCLIAVPLATWFLLGWTWRMQQPDAATEDRLERTLAAAIGGVLVALAVLASKADTHVGNTMWVRTREGMEAVGDDIVLQGPDWGLVVMLVVAAGFAFWISIGNRESQ